MMLPSAIILWIVLLRTCVAQQSLLTQLPSCAAKCFAATLPTTTCSSTDIDCLCSDTVFLNTVTGCNDYNCTVIEVLKSTNITFEACGIPVRSQSHLITAIVAPFAVVVLLMVTVRLVDRWLYSDASLGWDDLLIGIAGLSSIFQNVPVLVSAHYKFGTDIWGMTPNQITVGLHWLYFAYPFYMTTEAFCQLSILAFYIRIMTTVKEKTSLIVKGLMVFVVLFGTANTLCMIFQVTPISFFWDGWTGDVHKVRDINMNLFSFIRGGIEIALDLVILTIPLPILAGLQMSVKRKFEVMSMFSVGFVITAVSCARLHALVKFANTANATYDNTSTIYWCMIESNLFIIVACMPSIKTIFHRLWPNHRLSSQTGYKPSNKSSYFGGSGNAAKASGGILKSTDFDVSFTERSGESDIKLVDRIT